MLALSTRLLSLFYFFDLCDRSIERKLRASCLNRNNRPSVKKTLYWFVAAALIVSFGRGAAADTGSPQDWQIHEWGTFTSLQDEFGQAVGGINTDDEPVPDFVHGYFPILPAADIVPRQFNKGLPSCYPQVAMRLETPVIYFHPPQGTPDGQIARVNVHLRGGTGLDRVH